MPSWNLFEHQSDEYKAKVLPPDVKARVAVEQASTPGRARRRARSSSARGRAPSSRTRARQASRRATARSRALPRRRLGARRPRRLSHERRGTCSSRSTAATRSTGSTSAASRCTRRPRRRSPSASTRRGALAAGAELVVVTRGEHGSSAYTRDGRRFEAPATPAEIVSTLGAGDVFHGALLAQLVRDEPLARRARAREPGRRALLPRARRALGDPDQKELTAMAHRVAVIAGDGAGPGGRRRGAQGRRRARPRPRLARARRGAPPTTTSTAR